MTKEEIEKMDLKELQAAVQIIDGSIRILKKRIRKCAQAKSGLDTITWTKLEGLDTNSLEKVSESIKTALKTNKDSIDNLKNLKKIASDKLGKKSSKASVDFVKVGDIYKKDEVDYTKSRDWSTSLPYPLYYCKELKVIRINKVSVTMEGEYRKTHYAGWNGGGRGSNTYTTETVKGYLKKDKLFKFLVSQGTDEKTIYRNDSLKDLMGDSNES